MGGRVPARQHLPLEAKPNRMIRRSKPNRGSGAAEHQECHVASWLSVLSFGACMVSHVVYAGVPGEAQLEAAGRYFRRAELAPRGAPLRDLSYRRAEELAEMIVRDDPDSADAHFLLFAARGRRILEDNKVPSLSEFWTLKDLNKHLQRTLELNPAHADALAARGGLLLDLPRYLGGDLESARWHLERAISLNPTGPGTRICLARALMKQGHTQQAREQALLAAHYACRKRTAMPLAEAEKLLSELMPGR
jgi:hypothetical protein